MLLHKIINDNLAEERKLEEWGQKAEHGKLRSYLAAGQLVRSELSVGKTSQ